MKKKTAHETRQKICYKALWLTYIVLFYSLPSLFFHKQLLQLIRCIHESTTAMIVSHFGACFLTLEYEFLFARESFSFSEFVIGSFHSPLVKIFTETEKIWAKNVRIAECQSYLFTMNTVDVWIAHNYRATCFHRAFISRFLSLAKLITVERWKSDDFTIIQFLFAIQLSNFQSLALWGKQKTTRNEFLILRASWCRRLGRRLSVKSRKREQF